MVAVVLVVVTAVLVLVVLVMVADQIPILLSASPTSKQAELLLLLVTDVYSSLYNDEQ
jgi:hypothetical protein